MVLDRFNLSGKVAVITGGAGLLGQQHAKALLDLGATVVLLDVSSTAAIEAEKLSRTTGNKCCALVCDITDEQSLIAVRDTIVADYRKIDVLINNAANNPKVENKPAGNTSRLELFPIATWDKDLAVGLTGAFLCSRVFGANMAAQKSGVILNIASDLGLIGPDQRIYRKPGLPESEQFAKPVTYSVVKAGLIGLTRYLATYWAADGVRCNAICPGGVEAGQDQDFIRRLTNLIPLGRMAHADEYQAAIAFLCSDASSYMTGAVISMDGGRTCW